MTEPTTQKNEERKHRDNLLPSIDELISGISLSDFEQDINTDYFHTGRRGGGFGDGFEERFSLDLLKNMRYQIVISRHLHSCIPRTEEGNWAVSKENVQKLYTSLLDKIKFQTIVDLGCGFNLCGYQIARRCGFGAYVGVDVSNQDGRISNENWRGKKRDIARWMVEDNSEKNDEVVSRFCFGLEEDHLSKRYDAIPVCLVREDMLTFLKRIPNNSVSVMANGIDNFIIEGEYREKTKEEIKRVLSPEGLFLTDSLPISSLRKLGYDLLYDK